MMLELPQIAARFSRAAPLYQQHNTLQRRSASLLLDRMTQQGGDWLDLGCGPGTSLTEFQPQTVVAVDIATAMLQQLRGHFPDYQAICADAQNLPFKNRKFDAIFSNVALQWCADLGAVVRELKRVSRPGAEICVSMVADSLPQLQRLGLSNRCFASYADIRAQFTQVPWQSLQIEQQTIRCYFNDLRALLYSLKGVGASMVASGGGLRGRRYWHLLQQRAESLRTQAGLPLDYTIVLITARS
ncbi:methyltransferase domain-containing protein [Shewanella dokdonensis]|uniref:Methyltransferase domain-containing protein n=1 Tax=Shewanella dokdonensis TaxID=712036 RepID=A0ABX8DFL9_9GAMM|nr:methyltransferase domain-containing protein [Shewanella dokdonensis]MCL1075118.1 methyltransferase domain-containing protein [Shewanella dokdonensis]QVK23522.1 methyltransferase domain-containing protein [Shewanella dokdonensis]